MVGRIVAATMTLAILVAGPAPAAKKKSPGTTTPAPAPAPATPAHADSLPVTQVAPTGVAPSPGPLVKPGSPVAERTTIAPFPIPGDTSKAAIELSKLMNVPRVGETLVEPPRDGWRPSGSNLYWDPGGVTGPQQVDVFPEQRAPLAPEYPKAARDAGVQGTVMVMAWVKTDGTVGDTRVVKSIAALDAAAVAAVKQLRFKPASFQGKPVAVWVGVPVRFTIH